MKSFISAKQVVARLNGAISVKTVYKLVGQGKLRSNRATGKLLIEEESLIELMEAKPRAPPAPHKNRLRHFGGGDDRRRRRFLKCGEEKQDPPLTLKQLKALSEEWTKDYAERKMIEEGLVKEDKPREPEQDEGISR